MRIKIIAIFMVAICSFAGMSEASAQRTRVRVHSPATSVQINNGHGSYHNNGPRYNDRRRNHRYDRRHPGYHRAYKHASQHRHPVMHRPPVRHKVHGNNWR